MSEYSASYFLFSIIALALLPAGIAVLAQDRGFELSELREEVSELVPVGGQIIVGVTVKAENKPAAEPDLAVYLDPGSAGHVYCVTITSQDAQYRGEGELTVDSLAQTDSPLRVGYLSRSRHPQVLRDLDPEDIAPLAHQYSLWLRAEANHLPDCVQDASPCLPQVDDVPAFVRLPLETEWEYAARGGLVVDATQFSAPRYPMSEGIDAHAWHRGNANGRIRPIGTRAANPLGLHDVYGNVAELMLAPYRPEGTLDQSGAAVVRGGSVGLPAESLTAGYREQVAAVALGAPRHTGARLVAAVPIYTSPDKVRKAERQAPLGQAKPGDAPPPPEPVRFVGHLRVQVNVPADITLDGQPVGRATPDAPLEIEGIEIGDRRIEVAAQGYKPGTHQQRVVTNQWTEAAIELGPTPYIEPEMIALPGGRFWMGSPEDEPERYGDEGPRHEVSIKPFAIGKYEVTFDEYDRFAQATGRELPDDAGWGRGKRPVIHVSWEEAVAYAAWLSEQTGKHYRLPTEAEWEYAARAGTTTPFWTGRCIHTDQANYDGNYDYNSCGAKTSHYRRQTVEVGSLPANPWSLHEVHGNVMEWVQDRWHDDYRGAPVDGSAWESGEDSRRVVRGGSWSSVPWFVRSAIRFRMQPELRLRNIGFRLARTLTL